MTEPDFHPEADEAWDALLRQLPQQAQAQPRPFFYGRVRARLAAEAAAEKPLVPGWVRRPAYLALLGALVLSLSGDGSSGGGVTANSGPAYQTPQLLQR